MSDPSEREERSGAWRIGVPCRSERLAFVRSASTRAQIERDLADLDEVLRRGAWASCVVLAGVVMELALEDVLGADDPKRPCAEGRFWSLITAAAAAPRPWVSPATAALALRVAGPGGAIRPTADASRPTRIPEEAARATLELLDHVLRDLSELAAPR